MQQINKRNYMVRNVTERALSRFAPAQEACYKGCIKGHIGAATDNDELILESMEFCGDADAVRVESEDFLAYLRRDFGCPLLKSGFDMRQVCNLSPEFRSDDADEQYMYMCHSEVFSYYLCCYPENNSSFVLYVYDAERELDELPLLSER